VSVRRELNRAVGGRRRRRNKYWTDPFDPDAKVTKMKDGRTHVVHKALLGMIRLAGADASSQTTSRATFVWPKGYRVGELMATRSRRLLRGALDRIVYSSANYWITMLSDLAAALGFLALGLNWFSGPVVVAGGVVIVGFMSSGLLEYVLLVFGLYAGYNYFALVHHWQHHQAATTSHASPTGDDSSDSITSYCPTTRPTSPKQPIVASCYRLPR
jgi:hypothetical protein